MSWIWFLYLRAPVKATVTAKQRFVHLRNGLANSTQATSLLLVTPVQTSELNTSSSCHPSFKVEPCAGSIVSAAVAAVNFGRRLRRAASPKKRRRRRHAGGQEISSKIPEKSPSILKLF